MSPLNIQLRRIHSCTRTQLYHKIRVQRQVDIAYWCFPKESARDPVNMKFLTQQVEWGLGICIYNKLLGDANAAGLWTVFSNKFPGLGNVQNSTVTMTPTSPIMFPTNFFSFPWSTFHDTALQPSSIIYWCLHEVWSFVHLCSLCISHLV